ncbi:VWA domain-containing protein [Gulosibacter macacae]|uniref:VWA domain-containing protein n=1 Tax=Gulosibacter macacae TaxID=2488791 RepID=A0A3P3W0Y7_9MICO|nr:VWA domain-containing protein [Gulosibacter macacae]RRJ88721.1 VWA domain-containing protein [Gulosibacter macacae]
MALAFWWLPIVVLVAVLAVIALTLVRTRKSRTSGVPIANSERLTKLPGYRRALDRSVLLLVAAGIALGAIVLVATVAGSRWVYTKVVTPEKYNRDIVLCLDVSGSMVDYDAEVLDRYLEMLPGFQGERMALVLWNSSAVPVFPLTDDYGFVEQQLTDIRDDMRRGGVSDLVNSGTLRNPGASLVGDGLAACVMQFEGAAPSATEPPVDDGRSRSIILATDNVVNGAQAITLPQAAAYAQANFITVYGLDANEFEDAYSLEYRHSLDTYGGVYYQLTDPASVDAIVDTITNDQTSLVAGAPQLFVIDRPETWLWWLAALVPIYLVVVWRLRT